LLKILAEEVNQKQVLMFVASQIPGLGFMAVQIRLVALEFQKTLMVCTELLGVQRKIVKRGPPAGLVKMFVVRC
jgi:hypothetical protein